ncbi:hypothetical protein XENTR_v10004800 [Xenopus tropicalis]|nr:hypothetical protein XENTR_v10004800 [Xenopus tropicalis]KAE8621372.1 hypothetical protein XENTR_v10004800 [Xenopus tropicalis]
MEPNGNVYQPPYPVQPPTYGAAPYTIPVNPPPPPYLNQVNTVQYGAATPARTGSTWSRRKKICVITAIVLIKVAIAIGIGVGVYFARTNTYYIAG